MRVRWTSLLPLLLANLGLTIACSASQARPVKPASRTTATDSESPESERALRDPSRERSAPGEGQRLDLSGAGASVELRDGRQPDPSRALPRLSTRHIGMHIGGEENTPEAKAPFLTALSKQELDFLECYRLVDRPLAGGTFGVDLYIQTQGGSPDVRAVRQRLGGQEFERCMTAAFGRVSFPARPRPTMLSYSLRFDVDE